MLISIKQRKIHHEVKTLSRISELLQWIHLSSVQGWMLRPKHSKAAHMQIHKPSGAVCNSQGSQLRTGENVQVADLGVRAGPGTDDGDPPDDDGGAFGDQTFIVSEFWRGQMETAGFKWTPPTLLTWRWKCERSTHYTTFGSSAINPLFCNHAMKQCNN